MYNLKHRKPTKEVGNAKRKKKTKENKEENPLLVRGLAFSFGKQGGFVMANIKKSVLELVGSTPLVEASRYAQAAGVWQVPILS